MALADIPHAKPYDALELKELYTGADVYPSSVDTTTLKADAVTATNASIDAFDAMRPFADDAALAAAIATLKTTIATNIDDSIPDDITTTDTYHDVLDQVKADYDALVQAEGLTFLCPECAGGGLMPTYEADGVTLTGDSIESPTCEGYGYWDTEIKLDGNSRRFIRS